MFRLFQGCIKPVSQRNSGGLETVTWNLAGEVSAGATGKGKNHNCGFERDAYGNTISGIEVFYTGAEEKGDFSNSLWSYRIYKTKLN